MSLEPTIISKPDSAGATSGDGTGISHSRHSFSFGLDILLRGGEVIKMEARV